MIQSVFRAALGTGFTFAMTVLGAATVFFFTKEGKTHDQKAMMGFAAGVMTAAAVWSLLLPAIAQAEEDGAVASWLPAAVGISLGAAFLALLDAFLQRRYANTARPQDALLTAAITLHNIPEGMAVGLAFALAAEGEVWSAATLALGIGIQNFPEGAAVALPLRQSGASRSRAFLTGALSGAVEPIFGILVVPIACVRALMPWLLSFAAGAMLYVVMEELVPQSHGRAGVCGFMGGFLLMMILDVALG